MHANAFDRFHESESRLHRLDPRVKVVLTVLFILSNALLPDGAWAMTASATNTAWAGPWGVSFTANLTPDLETGLGRWTEADFVRTIRTGRHMGRGRAVLPPMPVMVYNHFSDRDLKAIFAYLRTLPPIRNKVPDPIPPVASASR